LTQFETLWEWRPEAFLLEMSLKEARWWSMSVPTDLASCKEYASESVMGRSVLMLTDGGGAYSRSVCWLDGILFGLILFIFSCCLPRI